MYSWYYYQQNQLTTYALPIAPMIPPAVLAYDPTQRLSIISRWYIPPDPIYMGNEQPFDNLNFAATQPIVNNPPFTGGAEIPIAVLNTWYIPVPPIYMGSEQPFNDQSIAPTIPATPVSTFVPPSKAQLAAVLPWYALDITTVIEYEVLSFLEIDAPPIKDKQLHNISQWWTQTTWSPQLSPKIQVSGPVVAGVPIGANAAQAILLSWFIPPSPFMGNDQPLQQALRTPPSNLDVFDGPTTTPQAILISWIPPQPSPFMGNDQPLQSAQLAPPQPNLDTFRGPTTTPLAVLAGWFVPAPSPNIGNDQPLQPATVTPPISGPAAAAPVLMPNSLQGVFANWYETPIVVVINLESLEPEIPRVPPTTVPEAVYLPWFAPVPSPIVTPPSAATQPVVNNPPFMQKNQISDDVLAAWIVEASKPPNPFFDFRQPLEPPKLPPPNPPVVNNPPTTGSIVPAAVLISHIPPPPSPFFDFRQPLEPSKLNPSNIIPPIVNNPPTTGSVIPAAVLISWIPPQPSPFMGNDQPLQAATVTPPISGPIVVPYVPYVRDLTAIEAWWSQPVPQPILPQPAAPPSGPVAVVQVPFTALLQTILDSWLAQPPTPELPFLGAATQPIVNNPPVIGSRVPIAVLDAWLPPPAVTNEATPPVAAILPFVSNPPVIGTHVPTAVFNAWLPPPPATNAVSPPFAAIRPIVNNPPVVGARVPIAVLDAWLPPDPKSQSTILLPAPSAPPPIPPGPVAPSILAQLEWWYNQPVPLPQFTINTTFETTVTPAFEIIYASVTVTQLGIQTKVEPGFIVTLK